MTNADILSCLDQALARIQSDAIFDRVAQKIRHQNRRQNRRQEKPDPYRHSNPEIDLDLYPMMSITDLEIEAEEQRRWDRMIAVAPELGDRRPRRHLK